VAGSSATSPTITTQPVCQTVTVGGIATFRVAASGTAPLSYQWQKNGTNITGATGTTYVTPATTSQDNGSTFRVIVSNPAGSVTSNSATLTVTSSGTLPPTAAAYAFDEGSGTTTRDSSGNGNTGTLVNSPAWTSGEYGSALGFGNGSYVTVPNSSSLNISGAAFSVSFFANITNSGGDQVLIDKPWDPTSYPVPYYQYGVEFGSSSGTFDFFLGDASGGVHKHSMSGPLGVWTHIAFTFDGSTVKGYVNGSLALSVADSFSMVARGNPLRIGLDHTGGQPTLGKLDNIRVYARTLSSTDVQNDQATPIAGVTGSTSLSINSGGGATGVFLADTDFSGGNTYATTTAVATGGVTDAAPAAVYQSERWGAFTYSVGGLSPGATYTVRLHFAEIWWSAAGQRIFNVGINGTTVLSNFDIVAAAGGSFKAVVKSFTATADSTGTVTLRYTQGSVDWPKSSGIEVIGP
ncbi:MAG TPA: LamG-like jellyroll fold domain-containing protein, partial [Planctomycetota bacterium]|nr:LamG-like jellyroll fold domain-containing protein [Planctomycetota bacterium]